MHGTVEKFYYRLGLSYRVRLRDLYNFLIVACLHHAADPIMGNYCVVLEGDKNLSDTSLEAWLKHESDEFLSPD